ncbi:MAG: fructosamine kinase family protein [Rhodomicrobium sp.]
MTALAEKGASLIGGRLRDWTPLTGGDLSQILSIRLDDGREAIVKSGSRSQAEARMLNAISETGAPAPAVLAVSEGVLVLERLPSDGSLGEARHSLGRAAATLHSTKGQHYGWPEDYAFGPVPIPNGWTESWPLFWAERRLLVHTPYLPSALARRMELLAAELPNRLPAQPSPSLLHGDLWSGNILAAENSISGLIDPACYYGHAEVDIAMLCLFASPSGAFYEAYGALEEGHEERLNLYQLWPALVHLRLFGNTYLGLVESLLSKAGL